MIYGGLWVGRFVGVGFRAVVRCCKFGTLRNFGFCCLGAVLLIL